MDLKKFENMEIKIETKKAIAKMGFEEATPIQEKAIPLIMTGKDFIGIAQTGTGKTCAFGIPAIEKIDTKLDKVQVLILCPTRELVIQTCEELLSLSAYNEKIKITPIYGGQQIERQIMALKKKPQIIVGTPGRIMDHMRRKTISFDHINMLVLDEADEMLNMGFREDLDIILGENTADSERQTILFSATMSKDILNITKKYQKEDTEKVIIEHKNITAPKIKQYKIQMQESKKIDVLTRILDAEGISLSAIFCNTKRKVDELEDMLRVRGYQVEALHGDMKQSQRDIVMKKFKSKKIDILIATDVAARGIDVDDIEVIFNYDIPADEEYYVHRIGRTGRAGKEGKAITFLTGRENGKLRDIEKYTNVKLEEYDVPSGKIVAEKKIAKLLDTIGDIATKSNLEYEKEILEKYLDFSESNLLEISAALIKMTLGDTNSKEIDYKEMPTRGADANSSRIFITVGKLDNMGRDSLRDYITDNTKANRADIFEVEVLDKFSFVTVSKEVAVGIIEKLNDSTYNNRRVCAEISTGKSKSSNSSDRRDFGRNRDSRSSRPEGRGNYRGNSSDNRSSRPSTGDRFSRNSGENRPSRPSSDRGASRGR